jgi:group I intron endonuclease
MTDTWILYQTTNNLNGKIYVGVHKVADTTRSRRYVGSGNRIRAAIKKYGRENFVRETLSEFSCLEDAYSAEAEMVTQEFIERSDTYNICLGGYGGGIQTPEMRAKNSASKKGRKFSEEHRKNISNYQKNRTEEHRANIGAGHKGKIISPEQKAKLSIAGKGRKHTPEAKAKMSIAQLGNKKRLGKTHVTSAETKEKLRAANSGANSLQSVAVVINEVYYPSGKFAAKAENVTPPTVSYRIKNTKSKWDGWRFATEEEIARFSAKNLQNV